MNKTIDKLREAEYFFRRMKEARPDEKFLHNLESFLSSAHEVTVVMRKELCKKPNFNEWLNHQQREMQADELLRFFNKIEEVRIREIDNHKKTSRRAPIAYIKEFYIQFPPHDGWRFSISKDGKPVWLSPKGFEFEASKLPRELVHVYVFDNTPKTFLGRDLTLLCSSPMCYSVVFLCSLYLGVLTALVKEANEKFEGRIGLS